MAYRTVEGAIPGLLSHGSVMINVGNADEEGVRSAQRLRQCARLQLSQGQWQCWVTVGHQIDKRAVLAWFCNVDHVSLSYV